MKWLVLANSDLGYFVTVEAESEEEAAGKGMERLIAEWPDELSCASCLCPGILDVHVQGFDAVRYGVTHGLARAD